MTEQGLAGDVRQQGVRALGWQTLSTVAVQAATAGLTLSVAAIVSPGEFALWGIAAVIFNVQNLVGSLGLGQALIYFRGESRHREAIESATVGTAAVAFLVGGAIALSAPLVAGLFATGFERDDVIRVVQLMSLTFLLATMGTLPQALIERAMNFRRRTVAELATTAGYVLTVIGLLLAGFGVWSLILGRLAQSALGLVLFWLAAPERPGFRPRIHLGTLRGLLTYGKFVVAGGIVTFATGNADTFAVGYISGAAALGAYALAFTVANFVPTFLSLTLGKVFFPLYAAVRESGDSIREGTRAAVHYLAAVMFPTTVALVVLGPKTLSEVFGDEWDAATTLIEVLAIYGLLRAVGSAARVLLAATGRPDRMLVSQCLALVVSLVALVPLASSGAVGVAIAFTLGQAASTLYAVLRSSAVWVAALAPLRWPAVATTAAIAGALLVRSTVSDNLDDILASICFVCGYLAVLLATDSGVRADMRLLRRGRSHLVRGA